MADLNIIRTQEELINVLSVLYFNLNEIERIYYDMFINTTPMDITFQRYDDLGVLGTITLPNRAKDAQIIQTGSVNPEGAVEAKAGVFYLDTSNQILYYKSSNDGKLGWISVLDGDHFKGGVQYLRPIDNGGQLYDLNASNISEGVLKTAYGGTGNRGTLSGLVKANGTEAFSSATDGVDYLGPTSTTGIICFYPVWNEAGDIIPGWLRCDGTPKKKSTYSNLSAKLGDVYGIPTVEEIAAAYPTEENIDVNEWFKIPNLSDYFIRCWDGVSSFNVAEADQVGKHKHGINFYSKAGSAHRHDKGDYNITGYIPALETVYKNTSDKPSSYGAFKVSKKNVVNGYSKNTQWDNNLWSFAANRAWTGNSGSESAHTHLINGDTNENTATVRNGENIVKNYQLVPIIKY